MCMCIIICIHIYIYIYTYTYIYIYICIIQAIPNRLKYIIIRVDNRKKADREIKKCVEILKL